MYPNRTTYYMQLKLAINTARKVMTNNVDSSVADYFFSVCSLIIFSVYFVLLVTCVHICVRFNNTVDVI